MKKISRSIYDYAKFPIEVDVFFSKKNLLSTDIVPLPHVEELTSDGADLSVVLDEMQAILKQGVTHVKRDDKLYNYISRILRIYRP